VEGEEKMYRAIQSLLICTLLITLSACGGADAPPPPPPQGPAGPVVPMGLTGFLEEQAGGVPWSQIQNGEEVRTALNMHFSGLGFVTITGRSMLDYVVTFMPQGPSQFQRVPNPNPPPQDGIMSYQIQGNADWIQFDATYGRRYNFNFTRRIQDYGLNLESTDQVALFIANGGGTLEILKVAYRTPNPVMQWYTVQDITMNGGYGSAQLRVEKRDLVSAFQSSPGGVPGQGW